MKTTINKGYKKPEYLDAADIQLINQNFDSIDTDIKNLEDTTAKVIVNNENKITNDITGNANTATKFKTPVNIFGLSFDGSKDIVEDDNHKLVTKAEKIIIKESSNPNLLINGDFQVWQRGTNFNGVRWTYTADRWRTRDTSTVKKENNTLILETAIRGGGIMQALEFNDSYKGRVVAFSINIKTNNPNNSFSAYIWDGTQHASCASSNTEFKTLTGSFRISENATLLHFCIETKTSNNSVLTINWAKLEWGEVATTFIPRAYAEEERLCKRYYIKEEFIGYNRVDAFRGFYEGTKNINMRVTPTILKTRGEFYEGKYVHWTGVNDILCSTYTIQIINNNWTGYGQFLASDTNIQLPEVVHLYATLDAEIY